MAPRLLAGGLRPCRSCAGRRPYSRDLPALFYGRDLWTKECLKSATSLGEVAPAYGQLLNDERSAAARLQRFRDEFQSFARRSLGGPAGTRHFGFAAGDRLDCSTPRSGGGKTALVPDHALLCDHVGRGASFILRIPDAGTWPASSLASRVSPFSVLCRYDPGPAL